MSVTYPKTLIEFKKLRSDFNNNKIDKSDLQLAESFITHWQVTTGAYALNVLVKVSGKTGKNIASDLGIKPRQLYEMMYGLNGLNPNKSILARYFNVSEDLLNDNRQIRKTSKT